MNPRSRSIGRADLPTQHRVLMPEEHIHLPHEMPACSTSTTVTADHRVINSQFMWLSVIPSRPERRSDDGQPILEPVQMDPEPYPDLVLWVELWGFEPQTSCMPCGNCQSIPVRQGRTGSLPPAATP
jgi:hypothetical protein